MILQQKYRSILFLRCGKREVREKEKLELFV